MKSRVVYSFVLAIMVASCGNAKFFGGTKKKAVHVPAPTGTSPTGTQNPAVNPQTNNPQIPVGQNPNVQSPNGQIPGTVQYPSAPVPNGQNPSVPVPNGQYPNGQYPNGQYPQTPNQGTGGTPCQSVQCQQPGQMPVNQGGQQTANNAYFTFNPAITVGAQTNAYYFKFEALNDNTTVTAAIAGLSGVEQNNNVLEIYSATDRVLVQSIPVNQAAFSSSSVNLRKGVYSIVVATVGATRDQFTLNSVTITGNQALRGIQSAAYNR